MAERAAKRRRLPARPLAHLSPCTDPSKRIPVTAEFSIGRGEHCALQLRGRMISRTHAIITHDLHTGDWIVSDRSTNGIFVGGSHHRVHMSRVLSDGDEVALGAPSSDEASVRLTFHLPPAPSVEVQEEEEEEEMLEEVETVGHDHGHQADRKDLTSLVNVDGKPAAGPAPAAALTNVEPPAPPPALAQPEPLARHVPSPQPEAVSVAVAPACASVPIGPSLRCEGPSACCRAQPTLRRALCVLQRAQSMVQRCAAPRRQTKPRTTASSEEDGK